MVKLVATTTVLLILTLSLAGTATADTFGSGINSFDIEFVTIGNPGNPDDTIFPSPSNPNPDASFSGSVPYVYRMGKFETSEDMIEKANTEGGLGISIDTRGADKPATSVTWNEAARFVNWLNTSQGYQAAYKFALEPGDAGYNSNADILLWGLGDAGYNPLNLFRNSHAKYVLPSFDEWYKAAYYDPNANGGLGGYWVFPTGSDSTPTAVASGTTEGTAVYNQPVGPFDPGPADIDMAGGLSPYGTMGQGGNGFEWEESEFDLVNNSSSSARGARGGFWGNDPIILQSFNRFGGPPTFENSISGFRVASVPEPSSLLLGSLACLGMLVRRRR